MMPVRANILSFGFIGLFIHYYPVWRFTKLLKPQSTFLYQINDLTLTAYTSQLSRDRKRLSTQVPYFLFKGNYFTIGTLSLELVGYYYDAKKYDQDCISHVIENKPLS